MSPQNIFGYYCPCGCFNSFDNQEVSFIQGFQHWFLILNHQQEFLGRCILILRQHKTDETELEIEEVLEKHAIYCQWHNAVKLAFGPDKINQSQLGNEEHLHKGHLHWHWVPRYRRPIVFKNMPFPYDTPETQKLNYSKLGWTAVCPLGMQLKIKDELLKYL